MSRATSEYYPPRARWYTRPFAWGWGVRRRTGLDALNLPRGISLGQFVLGLLVPGWGYYVSGQRFWGKCALAAWGVLLLVFIVDLGGAGANIAAGLMLSIHVSAVMHLLQPMFEGSHLGTRLLWSVLVMFAVASLLYLPARSLIQGHALTPMRVNGRVVVVQKLGAASSVRAGDLIAYTSPEYSAPGVIVHAGAGIGEVLAVGGDHVRFAGHAFEVNGVARPALPQMPQEGEIVVAQKHWFVWPDLAIHGGHGAVPQLSGLLLDMAIVGDDRYLGKPLKRWFWRKQTLS
jgi:hypothetical protein